MAKRIDDNLAKHISNLMFGEFKETQADVFLRKELERYVPEFSKADEAEIKKFIKNQRAAYIGGKVPVLGELLACLNPTFIDEVSSIKFSSKDLEIYTRASTKENGYRMQIHIGPQDSEFSQACALTRQFTPYDLRMFPEFHETLAKLPVMIGDSELVNKHYKHLAGFNRVDARLPDLRYWPKNGSHKIDDEFLEQYLEGHLFEDRMPKKEFELTLAFHGLFAIAHPNTWNKSRDEQLNRMISLCKLPMNYQKVDTLLNMLDHHINENNLNARVVERKQIKNRKQMGSYIQEKEDQGLEGVCVVQFARDEQGCPSFKVGKSFKIKKYETFDMALIGLYLKDASEETHEENISGAMLGLYDERVGTYVPALKVNLDPSGVQIKTKGQKERLTKLRKNIFEEYKLREDLEESKLVTLYDVYMYQSNFKIQALLEDCAFEVEQKIPGALDKLPRGKNFLQMLDRYQEKRDDYDFNSLGSKDKHTKTDRYVFFNRHLFAIITDSKEFNPGAYEDFRRYFSKAKDVKKKSAALNKPGILLNTEKPVILEAQVFDLKCAFNPFPAGFHSWYCDSFKFNNAFAERVRYDKKTTTDYATIYRIALNNTVKKKK